MNNEVTTIRLLKHVKRRLRPLLLALLCPLMAYADGEVGVKATVREGTTVKEKAVFKLSKTPRISFDSEGKLVMKLGDSNANVAELPLTNGAEMRITMEDYDESENKQSVTVSAANYSTLYSAFQMTVPAGVEVYVPEYDAENRVLKMNSDTRVATGTVLPAGTGIVLKNQGSYDFEYSDEEPAAITSALTGSVVSAPVTDFDGVIYSLAKEDGVVAFYRYAQPMTVGGKAFLVLPDTQQGKQITFAFDDIQTSIDETLSNGTPASNTHAPAYNLAGQQVGSGYRGIIIQNGKKIRR